METLKDNFSGGGNYDVVYLQNKVPIFQNKIYSDLEDALNAPYGSVRLVQSVESGFIYNESFNPNLMHYDINYQNEQSNSLIFQEHLAYVLKLLKSFGVENKRIVEIGCGKGVFFEKMLAEGWDCIGFDPTYEGENPKIIKEYFDEKYNDINADVIIMRHTLEHIPNPFSFIHQIAKANNYKGHLFVEVPTFDWIADKGAFWDIFYEHCNYFAENSLAAMFDIAQTGNFFGGQYIYLWADLKNLRTVIPQQQFKIYKNLLFSDTLDKYKDLVTGSRSMAIWGAGAKGSTFLNLLDPDNKNVKYVIDISPAKQNRHIACTGHKIYPPSILQTDPVDYILIMNENYLTEVERITEGINVKLSAL